jgi:hypothetical protein
LYKKTHTLSKQQIEIGGIVNNISRVLEKLIVAQLVKLFAFYGINYHVQKSLPAISPCPDPHKSSPQLHTPFL